MASMDIILISSTSLIVELIVLGLLIVSYHIKRLKNYRRHGIIMTIAVVLHLVTIFSWMIWSFLTLFNGSVIDFLNPIIVVAFVHVPLGGIAAAFGVYLVMAWHLQLDIQGCFGRKRIMFITFTAWLVSIALGLILYLAVIMST
ncbi:MAG TPA: hypothetical protein VK209_06205 [Candidatus Sulfotelmatobacter sp.]|nr:hypothetical protein [Candidatus Sulfotelmatobacter sp.]